MMLSPGAIFSIAEVAGLKLRGSGDKRTLCCPFHEDRHASAFVSASNVFYCSVCTPDRGWTAKHFSGALGLPWGDAFHHSPPPVRQVRREPAFSTLDAAATWAASFARSRDDAWAERDPDVASYLASRGLLRAWDAESFGVLPRRDLPRVIQWWSRAGYRLVAPLFDVTSGVVVSMQARAVQPRDIKVQTPKGGRMAGTVFADQRGQRLLVGERAEIVVFGEGLTDLLALSIASPWPVLTAPGTSTALQAVGSWARGAEVLLALDADQTGELAAEPVKDALFEHGARAVRRVHWPCRAKDACEVVERRGTAGLNEFLQGLGQSEAA